MRCLITAGPTYEPLDHVRRLTNFSTGSLGSELTAALLAMGHEVFLLRGQMSTHPAPRENPGLKMDTFTTTADLGERLASAASWNPHAVFHAAAVSDFAAGRVFERDEDGRLHALRSGKFSTRGPSLLLELVPTPKLITRLRDWFPGALLVGWKYEVDGTADEAIARGRSQLEQARTDAVVVNGPAYGIGFGFAAAGGALVEFKDRPALYRGLADWIRSHSQPAGTPA